MCVFRERECVCVCDLADLLLAVCVCMPVFLQVHMCTHWYGSQRTISSVFPQLFFIFTFCGLLLDHKNMKSGWLAGQGASRIHLSSAAILCPLGAGAKARAATASFFTHVLHTQMPVFILAQYVVYQQRYQPCSKVKILNGTRWLCVKV